MPLRTHRCGTFAEHDRQRAAIDLTHVVFGYEDGAPVLRRPIRIGRTAWIQGKATILKGVSIGDGAVVRWGALVTADVAPGAVVMGNPAVEVTGP